jgi:hypothetical protein
LVTTPCSRSIATSPRSRSSPPGKQRWCGICQLPQPSSKRCSTNRAFSLASWICKGTCGK